MQDPDLSAAILAFFGILWHFGIFAKKSNKKSKPIFPILSDFSRFLDFSRLLDFQIPQLLLLHILQGKDEIILSILIKQNVARRSNVAGLLCVIEGFILPTNPPGHWATKDQPEQREKHKK